MSRRNGSEQARSQLELHEQDAVESRITPIGVGHAVDCAFRQVSNINCQVFGTERHCRQHAGKRAIVTDVLPRHHKANHAQIDVEPVLEKSKTPFEAASGHVGRVVEAVAETVRQCQFDPATAATELPFDAESPVVLGRDAFYLVLGMVAEISTRVCHLSVNCRFVDYHSFE